ncbi:MAG: S1/P1 nuclease [Verrucomicrobiota bacterium]
MEKSFRSLALGIAALAVLLWSPPAALGWDDGGHMIVSEIAARRLHSGVARKIEALLPLLDARFNRGQLYNLTTAGAWMDDLRALGSEYNWAKWHYIDVPCTGTLKSVADLKTGVAIANAPEFVEPRPPHALWALEKIVALLQIHDASPEARAEAVAQTMHIVADIHQPMHVATRNDRGGNGFRVVPFTSSGKPKNLHQFWDAAYRYGLSEKTVVELWSVPPNRPDGPNAQGIIAEEATRLLRAHPPESLPELARPGCNTPHAWVRATHALAECYGWPCESVQGVEVELSPEFVERAHDIAEIQLVLAGCRLAELLNRLLDAK